MYRFEFASTLDDLLDAEAADRAAFLRTPVRSILIVLGVGWIVGAIIQFGRGAWLAVVWLLLGSGLLYLLGAKPLLRRRRIRATAASRQHLVLEFTADHIQIVADGVGAFTRSWDELMRIASTDDGILFYFSDGVTNWLPNREFKTEADRTSFLTFVRSRSAP